MQGHRHCSAWAVDPEDREQRAPLEAKSGNVSAQLGQSAIRVGTCPACSAPCTRFEVVQVEPRGTTYRCVDCGHTWRAMGAVDVAVEHPSAPDTD